MTIYALFIGVSEYPPGLSDLPGCAHDLKAMRQFWQAYVEVNRVNHNFITLDNEKATRQRVIDTFSHFQGAGPEDVCLLYYTGHGGQVKAPEELLERTTSGLLETLVLYDSRPGGRDLTDKEISYLLHQHTQGAGQVLTIFDSCHSGQVTRETDMVARLAPSLETRYAFDTLHGAVDYGENYPPQRAHVAFSACKNKELAYEMDIEGERRGIFTYALTTAMRTTNLATTSYEELRDLITQRINNLNPRQHAYAEAVPSGDGLKQLFLDGELKYNRQYVLDYEATTQRWFVGLGELQGVEKGAEGLVEVNGAEQAITVTSVDANRSYVSRKDWMQEQEAPYRIIRLQTKVRPLRLLPVDLPAGYVGNALEAELAKYPEALELVDGDPDYKLVYLKGTGITLIRPGEDRPLLEPVKGDPQTWLEDFVRRLVRVGRYEHSLAFQPAGYALDLDRAVDIKLEEYRPDTYETIKMPQDGTAVFNYRKRERDGKLVSPKYRLTIKVKEGYSRSLYVGGLYFDEEFAITNKSLPVTELEPGQELISEFVKKDGEVNKYVGVVVPKYLLEQGVTEIRNFLKVFVSEDPLSLSEHLQEGAYRAPESAPETERTQKIVHRGEATEEDEEEEDWNPRKRWNERTIPFTVHRPLVSGGSAGELISVTESPAGFQFATIHLESSASTTRSVESPLPPFPEGPAGLPAADLMPSRSANPNLRPVDMVELTGVNKDQAALIHNEDPLRLRLGGGNEALAFAYDEEFGSYYPVGFPTEDGLIEIHQLPEPSEESYSRSFGGSVKLFFRRIVSKYTGQEIKTNQLRGVTVDADETVEYLIDEQGSALSTELLETRVAEAKTVALFIHGIIGDTLTSPAVLQRAHFGDTQKLYGQYDLILAYDYENLNTPVVDTAAKLQSALKEVGLGEDHGKLLHIYAHSMGGLVSRYFIEHLKGDRIVAGLVQFGTPNGGSPYGKVISLATILLSRALKAGVAWQPWLSPLLAGDWLLKNANRTLQDMTPGSDLLKALNSKTERPAVPYFLINGNTRMISGTEADASFFAKIAGRFRYDRALDTVFFRQPNDIAVSLDSQREVPQPAVEKQTTVACDHLSYFTDEASIRALETYLPDLFKPRNTIV